MVAVSNAVISVLPPSMVAATDRRGESDSTSGSGREVVLDGGAEAAVAPRPGLDDVVGPERGVDGRGGRGLGRAGQDRDEPDQSDTDHQRRGSGRRCARGLRLAFSRARWPVAPDTFGGSAQEVHRRAGDDRAEHEHAEDGREHAEPEQLDGFGAGAGDTGGERDHAGTEDGEAEHRAPERRGGALDGGVPQGGDGLDAAGLEGRTDGRQHRDGDADGEGRRDRRRW